MKIEKWVHYKEQACKLGNYEWSIPRLILLAEELPVMEIPIEHLNIARVYKRLTLRDMVMHMQAVNEADLSKPIILSQDGEILDGSHRIMKALLNNEPTIKAVRFENDPPPCKIY